MRLSFCLFLIASLSIVHHTKGQFKDATIGKIKYTDEAKFMPGYFGCEQINSTDRTLSITLWIVLDSLGNSGYNENNLNQPIAYLNEIFDPIGLGFRICEINEIENFQFNEFAESQNHLDEILGMHYQINTINIYLTESLETEDEGDVAGFAALPGGRDIVFMTKGSMQGQSDVLIHEMGHFFGLYHTFEVEFGVELVDGSNCETTGDLVCDTEADPSDEANNNAAPDCNYNGTPLTDANGEFYVPPTNNFMSYYSSDCTCRFTPQQYNRMLEHYFMFRSNLW